MRAVPSLLALRPKARDLALNLEELVNALLAKVEQASKLLAAEGRTLTSTLDLNNTAVR